MKTTTMKRMAAGALVMVALALASGDADAARRPMLWMLKKGALATTETTAPARLSAEEYRSPLQYPEDSPRRQLSTGQRSLWDVVQSLMTAPLL